MTQTSSATKKPVLKVIAEITLIVLIFLALKTYMQRDLVSGPAPEFHAQTLSGDAHRLAQDQPTLIYFWASWCSICKLSQDQIQKLSREHHVVTVAMNSGDAATVRAFLKHQQLDFPVILDQDSRIAHLFGVSGVPTSFVVTAGGDIAFAEVGYTTAWGLGLRLWLAQFL